MLMKWGFFLYIYIYKYLLNKALIFKDYDCHRGKNSKDRIMLLVSTNMSIKGNLRLLAVGKSKNHRIFINVVSLKVSIVLSYC